MIYNHIKMNLSQNFLSVTKTIFNNHLKDKLFGSNKSNVKQLISMSFLKNYFSSSQNFCFYVEHFFSFNIKINFFGVAKVVFLSFFFSHFDNKIWWKNTDENLKRFQLNMIVITLKQTKNQFIWWGVSVQKFKQIENWPKFQGSFDCQNGLVFLFYKLIPIDHPN